MPIYTNLNVDKTISVVNRFAQTSQVLVVISLKASGKPLM